MSEPYNLQHAMHLYFRDFVSPEFLLHAGVDFRLLHGIYTPNALPRVVGHHPQAEVDFATARYILHQRRRYVLTHPQIYMDYFLLPENKNRLARARGPQDVEEVLRNEFGTYVYGCSHFEPQEQPTDAEFCRLQSLMMREVLGFSFSGASFSSLSIDPRDFTRYIAPEVANFEQGEFFSPEGFNMALFVAKARKVFAHEQDSEAKILFTIGCLAGTIGLAHFVGGDYVEFFEDIVRASLSKTAVASLELGTTYYDEVNVVNERGRVTLNEFQRAAFPKRPPLPPIMSPR